MAETTVFDGKIVIGSGAPPPTLEPPIIGYLYIDYTKPTIYACTDNRKGNITWLHLDQNEYIRLNQRLDEVNRKLQEYMAKLDDYMNGRWP